METFANILEGSVTEARLTQLMVDSESKKVLAAAQECDSETIAKQKKEIDEKSKQYAELTDDYNTLIDNLEMFKSKFLGNLSRRKPDIA